MSPTLNFAQGIIHSLTELAPTFVVICFVFIIFSWLRVLVDAMSGRDF